MPLSYFVTSQLGSNPSNSRTYLLIVKEPNQLLFITFVTRVQGMRKYR